MPITPHHFEGFRKRLAEETNNQLRNYPVRYSNWRKLTEDEIRFEYMVEYSKLKPWSGDIFPTENDFIREFHSSGGPLKITKHINSMMGYRSNCSSIECLKSLVATYRYPRDVDRIIRGYVHNHPMPYPVVVHSKRKGYRVMGGNTRMDVAFILGFEPVAWVVEIP